MSENATLEADGLNISEIQRLSIPELKELASSIGIENLKSTKKYKLINAKDAHADLEARKLIGPAIFIP